MRKHEYEAVGEPVLTTSDFTCLKFRCKHCGDEKMLDKWQLREMPRVAARCSSSTVKSTWLEWWTSSYYCLAKGKSHG